MAVVGGVFLAGDIWATPDVSWTPFVWIVVVLAAATVYLAFQVAARRSRRVIWAGALAGLAIATVGTGVWGNNALNVPLDDPGYFCNSPDPSPPSSIAADTILQDCAAGKTISLSRDETVAVALVDLWNVDVGTQWIDLAAADPNVLREVRLASVPGPANSQLTYLVGVYRANQPGETTLSAVQHCCNQNFGSCDRGRRWSVTIKVT